ncbi:DNA-directed RNA polymerase subunit H [Candidatus Bathyarchaeota archaeon]|nr:DNA-directed RNA polymerase subunit H [Candidatus Bathyarchaeota archaeon]
MKFRRYKLKKREEQENIITLLAKVPRERKHVLIWCIQARVVGVAYVEKLKKAMKAAEVEKGMIVANTKYTFAARKRSKKYGIELIPKRFPSFDIFKHELVPKHEILSSEEAKELLEKYRLKPYQLPHIKRSDVAAIAIGAQTGDILKVTRKSLTAGKYVSYRYVAPS